MYAIESGIVDLLIKHNCVVIPSFGGFIGKKIPSRIDAEKGLVYPPSKQFLFNINLIENDGLLAHYLAAKSILEYQAAENYIAEKVKDWHQDLHAGRPIVIHQLGILQRNANGIVVFTQDEFSNLLLQSYGLKELAFVPSEEEVENVGKIIELFPDKKKRQLWKYAAAACFLPIAFYSFWLPTQTDVFQSKVISLADFNPFNKKQSEVYQNNPPVSITPIISEGENKLNIVQNGKDSIATFVFDEQTSIAVRLEFEEIPAEKKGDNKKIISENQKERKSSLTAMNSAKYNVVVGCFSKISNVEKFVEKLRKDGFDATHVKFGTLFRVLIKSTDSLDVATDLVKQSRQKGYKGWILKK